MSFSTVFDPTYQAFYNFVNLLEVYKRLSLPFRFYYKKGLTERSYYIHEIYVTHFTGYYYSKDGKINWRNFKYELVDPISQPITCVGCLTCQQNEEIHMGTGGCLNIGELNVN
jgi:hypothetical protein